MSIAIYKLLLEKVLHKIQPLCKSDTEKKRTLTKAAVLREWLPFITRLVSMANWFTVCKRDIHIIMTDSPSALH